MADDVVDRALDKWWNDTHWRILPKAGLMRQNMLAAIEEAVKAEREACARVVEAWAETTFPAGEDEAAAIVAAIRARGEKGGRGLVLLLILPRHIYPNQ